MILYYFVDSTWAFSFVQIIIFMWEFCLTKVVLKSISKLVQWPPKVWAMTKLRRTLLQFSSGTSDTSSQILCGQFPRRKIASRLGLGLGGNFPRGQLSANLPKDCFHRSPIFSHWWGGLLTHQMFIYAMFIYLSYF